jgi:hypothetical protein
MRRSAIFFSLHRISRSSSEQPPVKTVQLARVAEDQVFIVNLDGRGDHSLHAAQVRRSEFYDVGFFGHGMNTPKLKPKPVSVAVFRIGKKSPPSRSMKGDIAKSFA